MPKTNSNTDAAAQKVSLQPPNTRDLVNKISYKVQYFNSADKLLEEVRNKTIVPRQVEVQPGRLTGRALCWMPCPYCYGGSSENNSDRLSPDRYLEIIRQTASGPHGGVSKLIFAGYATDPLNYEHIDDLIEVAIQNGQAVGVHSKLIKVSDHLIGQLTKIENSDGNYITVSVDAGSSQAYNSTHGLPNGAKLYGKVLENIRRLVTARNEHNAKLDISANYLITLSNASNEEAENAIRDLTEAGVDSIRFSFPQIPRGFQSTKGTIIPTRKDVRSIYNRLQPLMQSYSGNKASVVLLDVDGDREISEWRTLPCFARFIYPAISYDGFLSNCSQSAAPHFRDMALGDLKQRDFWEAYYDYDSANLGQFLHVQHEKMKKNDCRCDRKEHVVNGYLKEAIGDQLDK